MRIFIILLGVFFLLSKVSYSDTIPFDSIDYYIEQNDYTKVHGLLSKLDSTQIRQPHDVEKLMRGVSFIINKGDYGEAVHGYEILSKQTNLEKETQLMIDFLGAKLYSEVDNRTELEPILERIEQQKEMFAGDSLFLARYYIAKMNYEGMKGQFDEAMKYAIELLNYIEASHNEVGKASVFLTIGEIFRFNERFEKALEYYRKAEDIALQYDLFLVLGKTYNNQSIIMKNLGDTLQEIEYLKKSIRYMQASGNKTSVASSLYNLSQAHLNLKQYDESSNLLRQVVDLGQQYNFEKALYFGYYGYGMLFIEKKQYKDAKYYLDKAMGIAKQMNHTPSIGRIYFTYYKYYQKLNQFDKALHYYKLDQELRDSLRMSENQALIDGLEAKYQLSEKEKENQELRLQQIERDTIIAKQRLTFFLIGALLLVLFFVVAIFYINLRNKNKQNLILQAQKMQMDEKNKLLTELNDEVTEQKFQLEEVNKVKDRMFSIISHDLRSPIGSVYMLMRMVEQGNMDKEKSLGMLRELTHEVNQALFLLNNLLTWTHININPTPPQFAEVALSEVINENIDFFETEFHYKGLNIVSKVSDHMCVWVDKSMLHTILQNLLSNAIKFSHVDTSIEIDAKVIDKQIVLQITNQGQIIEKSKIDQLFEVGERLGKGTKNERGGGLGLYISKYYTEAMGGALNLKSFERRILVEVTLNISGKLS